METPVAYDLLAQLLAYPSEGYAERVAHCREALEPAQPDASLCLASFAQAVEGRSVEELQELFIQTFDLNPVCSLEVGWQLFGENYERGNFLVEMRDRLRQCGVRESAELPDHLTHVLQALGRMDPGDAEEFRLTRVGPAVENMVRSLAGRKDPFEGLLKAIACVLETGRAPVGLRSCP